MIINCLEAPVWYQFVPSLIFCPKFRKLIACGTSLVPIFALFGELHNKIRGAVYIKVVAGGGGLQNKTRSPAVIYCPSDGETCCKILCQSVPRWRGRGGRNLRNSGRVGEGWYHFGS